MLQIHPLLFYVVSSLFAAEFGFWNLGIAQIIWTLTQATLLSLHRRAIGYVELLFS